MPTTVTLSQIPVPRSLPNFLPQSYPSLSPGFVQTPPNSAPLPSSTGTSTTSGQAMSVGYNSVGMQFTFPQQVSQGFMPPGGIAHLAPQSGYGDVRVNQGFFPQRPGMMLPPHGNHFGQQIEGPHSETYKTQNHNNSCESDHQNSNNVLDKRIKVNNGAKSSVCDNTWSSGDKDSKGASNAVSISGLANLMKQKPVKSKNDDDDDDDYDS